VTPFITDDQLTQWLMDALQKGPDATLEDLWASIITQSNWSAFWEIFGKLSSRGFTQAQILAWDRGAEFNRHIALFFCLSNAQAMAPEGYDKTGINSYDRRPELLGDPSKNIGAVFVTNAGVIQDPGNAYGQVVAGPYEHGESIPRLRELDQHMRI
jgi:hypothetical protein